MVGQRVDVLTRTAACPGVVAARTRSGSGARTASPSSYDDLFLDVGAKDGDELAELVRPATRRLARRAARLRGNRVASRAFDNRIGCYVALESARGSASRRSARRRDRRRRRAGGGGRLRRLAHAAFASSRTSRSRSTSRTRPTSAAAITRTRASRPRRRPDVSRGPSIHRDVFELLYETAEAERIPFARRGLARLTSDGRGRRLSQPPGVPTGSSPCRFATCTRPSRQPTLEDSSAPSSSIVAFALELEPGMSFARLTWKREQERHRLRRPDAVRQAQRRPRRVPRDRARRDRDPRRPRARRSPRGARSTT
jgi:endoglucanase